MNDRALLTYDLLRAARQCGLRAWRTQHEAPRAQPSHGGADAYSSSDEVRRLAASLWPDAVDARAGTGDWTARAERTRALRDAGVSRIANAAVDAHDGTRVTVDLLERDARGHWIALMVRPALRVSWSLADRAAYALHVLQTAGWHVSAVHGLLLRSDVVRGDAPLAAAELFVRRSLSFPARRRRDRVAAGVTQAREVLARETAPDILPGAQCRDDRDGCPYLDDCTRHLPDDWTGWAPRKDQPPVRQWLADGHVRLRELPADAPMPRGVAHARLASLGDGRYLSPDLATMLVTAGPPTWYLDFECVAMALPAYVGTSPYATVPFLWSLHHEDARGALTHRDDIAPPSSMPPWRRMAEGLIAALGTSATPIVVYSSYERERLDELATVLPDLEPAIRAIQARLVDLLDIVRGHVYDLRFRGSFSMKQVAPALVPDLSYGDLAIQDGLAATLAYERLLRGTTPHREEARTLDDLRAYCARDTFAMVRLLRTLRALASEIRP